MLILMYNDVYIHRLRAYVCGYFYRKREKTRILYLYNFMLKRRKKMIKYLLQKVGEKMREKKSKVSDGFVRVSKYIYVHIINIYNSVFICYRNCS